MSAVHRQSSRSEGFEGIVLDRLSQEAWQELRPGRVCEPAPQGGRTVIFVAFGQRCLRLVWPAKRPQQDGFGRVGHQKTFGLGLTDSY